MKNTVNLWSIRKELNKYLFGCTARAALLKDELASRSLLVAVPHPVRVTKYLARLSTSSVEVAGRQTGAT